MLLDHENEHPSRWAATSIAEKIVCSLHTSMDRVKKGEVESGRARGVPCRGWRHDHALVGNATSALIATEKDVK